MPVLVLRGLALANLALAIWAFFKVILVAGVATVAIPTCQGPATGAASPPPEPAKAPATACQPPATRAASLPQEAAMGADLVVPAPLRREIEDVVGDALSATKLVAVIRRLVKCWEERHAFTFPCAGCGKEIEASPAREWKALVDAGCLAKWRHSACHALTSASGDVDDDGDEGLDGEDDDGDGE